MTQVPCWIPTRGAALSALNDFLPRAAQAYAEMRNEDRGPGDRTNVSGLSPWIRTRLLAEPEVVAAVLEQHAFTAAEKFIQEVCWRTYWRGWLEARPGVWHDYLAELRDAKPVFEGNRHYRQACEGRTGIDCFDFFARELVETGYLHNHARMWFASIWIFTLRLPWVLGADFFMRHLLDGDAASNTLSWRWVAGLQTAGKHYAATADNIRRYTAGRFRVEAPLASNPPLPADGLHFPEPVKLPPRQDPVPDGPVGLLVGEDDLSAVRWVVPLNKANSVAFTMPVAEYKRAGIDERVIRFRSDSVIDCYSSTDRMADRALLMDGRSGAEDVVAWARERRLVSVLMAEPPVGLWDPCRKELERELAFAGIRLIYRRHAWDQLFYPHATKGYFHLKKQLPELIRSYVSL